MKKFAVFLAATLACVALAMSAMDDVTITKSVVGAAVSTNTVVVRGEIMAVRFVIPDTFATTGALSVATEEATILTNATTSTIVDYPRVKVDDTTGANLTWWGPDNAYSATSAVHYVYEPAPSAGPMTIKIIGGAGSVYTNSYTVKLIIKK